MRVFNYFLFLVFSCIYFFGFENINSEEIKLNTISFDSSIKRKVTCVAKDKDGNVIGIGGDWGYVSEEDAVEEILQGKFEYYVEVDKRTLINVVSGNLKTGADSTGNNNLKNLKKCRPIPK